MFTYKTKACLLAIALWPALTIAQVSDLDLRLPMSLDADKTSYDGKNSLLLFTGLRLSQGHIGIEADEGRATRMDFEDSVWQFSGNVIIDIENGHIECDAAELKFDEFQLKVATVTGSPATFELKRTETGDVTYAEAGKLVYDIESGVIEFSDNATITEGGNQISSSFLVYNIAEQRINAESSGSEDGRVRITYTPTNSVRSEDADATAAPSNSEEDIENP
jgi:lipopolysaccharide transport protein LptA